MKKQLIILCGLAASLLMPGCGGGTTGETAKEKHEPTSPQLEARYNRSSPAVRVDVEQALKQPESLKLSQFASEVEYYIVGNAGFNVTQVISVPDSNAVITLNKPRIYYRKPGNPSKRYGYKVLDYRWNNDMNGCPMFYDKKTTRMYVALSGNSQQVRKEGKTPIPSIDELPPLDTMLTITNYRSPENTQVKYPLNLTYDRLLGFSSAGYTLCHYEGEKSLPDGILTFNLEGDTLCRIPLREGMQLAVPIITTDSTMITPLPSFQTYYWNTEQDKMTFMIPFCDTVYQLSDPQTITPLYAIDFGAQGINPSELDGNEIAKDKIWLKTMYENPKGLFLALFQKGKYPMTNWTDNIDEFRPQRTQQVLHRKEDGKTYMIQGKGLINDLDDGLPFWPDGQTDDCLYMLRTITELRETLKRTGSPRQKRLIEILDDKNTHERDFLLIVVR